MRDRGGDHPGQLALTFQPVDTVDSIEMISDSAGDPSTVEPPDASTYSPPKHDRDAINIDSCIFPTNVPSPTTNFKLPEPDGRLHNTPQLVCCLGLLQASQAPDVTLDPALQEWLQVTEKDTDEQNRLRSMAIEVVRAYKRDEMKDAKIVTEVVYLAPVLDKVTYRDLLLELHSGIKGSELLNVHQLDGIARLIQEGGPGYLDADDLVKILGRLSDRLKDTHQQSIQHLHQLTVAVSNVLDAMADANVTDLDRVTLHEPLSSYLKELKGSSDPYLVYQAAYAYQALLCVPDNEPTWQAAMRRTGKVIQGVSGLVSAVKGLDLGKFVEGLRGIQKGFEGVVDLAKETYDNVMALKESGQQFLGCLTEGFSFDRKRDWYSALRGADAMIRDGELAEFRTFVCGAPCRLDPAFQWGVSQRLGEIAGNPKWNADVRQSAILFLGEIYRNDAVWGRQPSVKQWIINILGQLASLSANVHITAIETLLQDLATDGDANKQALYRACREKESISYPLKLPFPELASPSLLDRVQGRADVDGSLRLLRKHRTKERGNALYIAPRAKPSSRSPDASQFPLMEKVKEFLGSDRKVFLLLGDSGAGKSTFNRELEYELWKSYKNKNDTIPLYINLPSLDKPEHDMIAKQLRRNEFSEPEIRELKFHGKFVLICDGYDESQQTHNLYMSNELNQKGGWNAQMVVSCRSEYLGDDYRHRFQPEDRNKQSDSSLFQEAVISPFSIDQVHAYIHEYVMLYQPLWQANDYKQALEHIPSLKELVKNPFLMALSLEVLPRMVDPGQQLSTASVTRVRLYDHFVEQWLERGKKRIGEKEMSPQFKATFEKLSAEGFTVNGIGYMKKLAVAIYKEQHGHPVVEYSQLVHEGSWKDAFFNQEHKQLLLEASPLTRNGNQHRFIHRSLQEYAFTRAIFDPLDRKNKTVSGTAPGRRRSVSSTLSFEICDGDKEGATHAIQEPDYGSPLTWRSFANDHSLLQFLEERVQQEPMFREQLLSYVEHSKVDKKWRTAAANAITILVRAGVQFNGADLRGIRIPGADLSYGSFDSAQLQDADLRKVNLRGVWMRQADLGGAHMTGVQFGELPLLTEDDAVWSCAYSPDGKSLAVGLSNGKISVYTTSKWEKALTMSDHTKTIWRVVYSPNSKQMASCDGDGNVKLWDVDSGECKFTWKCTDGASAYDVAFSPQGDLVAAAGYAVEIWNTTNGELQDTLGYARWREGVYCIAFSTQGNQIAVGHQSNNVHLWDLMKKPEHYQQRSQSGSWFHLRSLSGHTDDLWRVTYSPTGDQIATSSEDKTIRLWDVGTGTCRHILTGHVSAVWGVAFSLKGDRLVSTGIDETVRIWDVESGTCIQTLVGHTRPVMAAEYSPKGGQIASASKDCTVRLWDISAGASPFVPSGHSLGVTSVGCSPDGDLIVTGSTDFTARVWSVETGECRRIIQGHERTVFGVAFSPQGDRIATASGDKTLRLWDLTTGTCQHTLTGHEENVYSVAYSPDGQTVTSSSVDKTVRLWDVSTGTCLSTMSGHTEIVFIAVFSPNGKQIASCSEDNTVRLWATEDGVCQQILEGHDDSVYCVAYSPQGSQLASISRDMTVRLWDVESRECRFILIGHEDSVVFVAYSLEGNILASSSYDMTVRLWSNESGDCLAVIRDFRDQIGGLAWGASSGTPFLVTGCTDGSLLKWEVVQEGEEYRANLRWGTVNGRLNVTGASIENVRGLSQSNKQLLKQRGATGEPEYLLQGTSKKVVTMVSVVSTLKRLSEPIVQETLPAGQDGQDQTDEQSVGEQLE
ncbi:hypothetical protein BGX34_000412 [Mortierella sp. NVP85]|nr:hypothetical protein BGX34_000412 [Mortierella sp. NVP85]